VSKYLNECCWELLLILVAIQALKETKAFIEASGLPFVTAPMAKGAIDESMPNYCGIYAGSATRPDLKERVESADLVLTVGSIKSDFNTAGFTYKISQLSAIDFHSTYVRVKYSEYPGIRMNGVLAHLTEQFKNGAKIHITPGPKTEVVVPKEQTETITHSWVWPRLSSWLKPNDVVVTETGTSNFGIMETKFPPNVTTVNQYLWGSIGYATPATQGAAAAARELGLGRTILWTGGSYPPGLPTLVL
jgi:pyruvate decarboxylase